jgi:hypothetical protein
MAHYLTWVSLLFHTFDQLLILFILQAFKPMHHGEDYFYRKFNYGINGLVVCDDRRRIRYFYMGWAGSVHDQRVFRNSNLFQRHDDYFLNNEYILGDSAYKCLPFPLPVFKRSGSTALTLDQICYNGALAHLRIAAEHAIGMLKGRFQCLKALRFLYQDEAKMITIIKHVECCIILHNLLIDDVKDFTDDELHT